MLSLTQPLDRFSPCVKYWVEVEEAISWEKVAGYYGSPSAVAQVFGVSLDSISRYYQQWQLAFDADGAFRFVEKKKVYAGDEFTTGDAFQCRDFLRAIGSGTPSVHFGLKDS